MNLDNPLNISPVFDRIFKKDQLSFGFLAPLQGYPNGPLPDLTDFEKIVRKADDLGLDAIWLRDVPFLDPNFGDAGQVFDAMVYAGWLAGITKQIAIGTAGIVLPLRDPIIVAKQAATVDLLSGGRMLLGLASGDRYSEYPAFGLDFENRTERYREARGIIKTLTEESFPVFQSKHYGSSDGDIDLVPKPATKKISTLSIGRAGQTIEWMAEKMDGWIWHGSDPRRMTDVIPQWEAACNGIYKPFGYGVMFDLSVNPDEPVAFGRGFLRGGRNHLINFWEEQRLAGLSHTALNLKPTRRPAEEILEEFAEFIVPQFR